MAVGDVTNPKRVRMQANERLDTSETDGFSIEPREHLDAISRAVVAVPRNVGAAVPTGLILQGFGLTLNPTGASDGKVRVQSALGVALDADGRMLIKEAGVQVDLTLSAGNSQIYVHYVEGDSDVAVRRRTSITSPYAESGVSMATKFKSSVSFFVRAGDQTTIVASDVVNGVTTPLCFLGVANNTAGVVTMTGYNVSTAPNGAFATNRITTVAVPTTLPPGSAANGSIGTLHDLVSAALYLVGQLGWKGSRNVTPTAANNFQAFALPTGPGLDALFDSAAETVLTPITTWRDWNLRRRSVVDHNGYRMGQVSERDDSWDVPPSFTTVFDMYPSQRTAGAGGGFGVAPQPEALTLTTSGQTFVVDMSATLRHALTVTACTVDTFRNSNSDVFQLALESQDPVTLERTTLMSAESSSGLNQTTVTLAFPANFGGTPRTLPVGTKLRLKITGTTIAANEFIRSVSLVSTIDPVGWTFVSAEPFDLSFLSTPICRRVFVDPIAGFNQRAVLLTSSVPGATLLGASTNMFGRFTTEVYECFLDADVCYVQEWMMRTGTIVHANNNRSFAAGIQSKNVAAENRFIYFYNENTMTNWQLRVVGSVIADTDTGVAIVADTVYRMRLEVIGANVSTAGVGAFRVKAYINGTLVASVVTTTFPTADAVRPYFHVGFTSIAGGVFSARFGRIRRVWNHVLNGDNL